jgi:uncharacterized membrane protein
MFTVEESTRLADDESVSGQKFLMLLVAGFSIMLLGMVITVVATLLSGGGSTSTGIIIFIGPIPLILGAGPQREWLILVSLILAIVTLTLLLIMRRRTETMTV